MCIATKSAQCLVFSSAKYYVYKPSRAFSHACGRLEPLLHTTKSFGLLTISKKRTAHRPSPSASPKTLHPIHLSSSSKTAYCSSDPPVSSAGRGTARVSGTAAAAARRSGSAPAPCRSRPSCGGTRTRAWGCRLARRRSGRPRGPRSSGRRRRRCCAAGGPRCSTVLCRGSGRCRRADDVTVSHMMGEEGRR